MKRLISTEFIVYGILLTFTIIAFQNCSGVNGFSSKTESSSTALNEPLGHGAPHITSVATNMVPNANLEFKLHTDVALASPSYIWSHQLNGVSNACLVISGSTAQNYIINCKNDGALKVSAAVSEANVKIAVQDFAIPIAAANVMPTVSNGLNATFVIQPGTGTGPWNSAATAIEVYVGQTLTFQNKDTVKHQMHTGGKPCPHSTAAAPGGSFLCVITSAFDSVISGGLYDHGFGNAARVYLIAHDGAQLYSQNCMGCHGALAVSQVKNSTAAQIKSAITSTPQMSSVANLLKLTPKQIEAISYALSK